MSLILKEGKTNLKYILIIAILAAIVGGGILIYQYWWLPKEEAERSKTKPLAVPLETVLPELSDYKNYSNENSYLSFKYPKDWGYLEFDEGKTIYLTDADLKKFLQQQQEYGELDLTKEDLHNLDFLYDRKALVRISVMDIKSDDAKFLIYKFGGERFYPMPEKEKYFKFSNGKIGDKAIKFFDSTSLPKTKEEEEQAKYMKDNVITTTSGEMYIFPELQLYYFEIGKYSIALSLISLNNSQYTQAVKNIISMISIYEPKIELKTYQKNGLTFTYPADWTMNEEWSGRNKNLGEVDIDPEYSKYESSADKSIRIYIRPVGTTIGTERSHIISPKWKYVEETIDGHTGKRYYYIGSSMSYEEVNEEHVLVQLNEKYEIDIWNENADIHKYTLDNIIKSMKIDLVALDNAVKNIKPY